MSAITSSSSMNELDQAVKVVVLGAERTGKTALVSVYQQGTFNEEYVGTVGLDNTEKTVYLPHGKVKAKLWDIGGHPRFRPLLPTYLKGADGVLVVYAVTDRTSYNYAIDVLGQLEELGIPRDRTLLVGTKHDCHTQLDVSRQEADMRAETLHVRHLTASATNRQSVERCFNWVVSKCMAVEAPSWYAMSDIELDDQFADDVTISIPPSPENDASGNRNSTSSLNMINNATPNTWCWTSFTRWIATWLLWEEPTSSAHSSNEQEMGALSV
eukprot:m.15728 g.15728  ORF g.15728 m.15728 type:complete len:270 (-) comp10511_c0_seq1:79-888(-)